MKDKAILRREAIGSVQYTSLVLGLMMGSIVAWSSTSRAEDNPGMSNMGSPCKGPDCKSMGMDMGKGMGMDMGKGMGMGGQSPGTSDSSTTDAAPSDLKRINKDHAKVNKDRTQLEQDLKAEKKHRQEAGRAAKSAQPSDSSAVDTDSSTTDTAPMNQKKSDSGMGKDSGMKDDSMDGGDM
jgi:hypothetical protein